MSDARVVWARNDAISSKASRVLALHVAKRSAPEFADLPGDRVINAMLWRPMPAWFAADYGVEAKEEPGG